MRTGKMAGWTGAVKIAVLLVVMLLALFLSGCGGKEAAQSAGTSGEVQAAVQSSAEGEKPKTSAKGVKYTQKDIERLRHTENFAKGALEHIFSGTINKKGKATGYHYSMVEDSSGKIIDGTRSKQDVHGVFTAKVQVRNVRKNGFSSFYPETWSPQEVVDAINEAYEDAVNHPGNPRGELWIGHAKGLEIDMYLNDKKKILTAYPVFVEK